MFVSFAFCLLSGFLFEVDRLGWLVWFILSFYYYYYYLMLLSNCFSYLPIKCGYLNICSRRTGVKLSFFCRKRVNEILFSHGKNLGCCASLYCYYYGIWYAMFYLLIPFYPLFVHDFTVDHAIYAFLCVVVLLGRFFEPMGQD